METLEKRDSTPYIQYRCKERNLIVSLHKDNKREWETVANTKAFYIKNVCLVAVWFESDGTTHIVVTAN